jgi:hypothetical protein
VPETGRRLTFSPQHHRAFAVRTPVRHGIRHTLQEFAVKRALETDNAAHVRLSAD